MKRLRLFSKMVSTKNKLMKACKEEKGEVNIIAIILIVIVVIALVAIFRQQLIDIISGLFQQIKDTLGI